jgi:uncharacterized protein YybS (DUF2232 family)
MKSTRTMVETSLLVALSVVLFLASHFLPVIGIIISFFCPVPLVILGLKVPVQNASKQNRATSITAPPRLYGKAPS